MANLLPTPVAAVLGIVPAVLDGVRRLPGRAVQLPVIAVSKARIGKSERKAKARVLIRRRSRSAVGISAAVTDV